MNEKPIIIVQGSQWGSEGKGMVAGALCRTRRVDCAVRTGAVNAGHTVYKDGKAYKMQQLPVGWVAGDDCTLIIGPGAYVHPEILSNEVKMVREAGYEGRIFVDHRAGLHLPEHTERAGMSGRHYLIGATGKGCSEAIVDRIKGRGKGGQLFVDWFERECGGGKYGETAKGWEFADTVSLLHDAYDAGDQILLEGTQGSMLDLYLGPYPYTTHKQTLASQWVTEAGLSPGMQYEIVAVARTYPIRVAGNSGPMPSEISWTWLGYQINHKLMARDLKPLVDPSALMAYELAINNFPVTRYSSRNIWMSESARDAWNQCTDAVRTELSKLFEFTTVTKKLRRVAELDIPSLRASLRIDRPSWVCLTFLNYVFPHLWGMESGAYAGDYLDHLSDLIGYPIDGYTTGPDNERHFFNERSFRACTRR
jgi:adenylosuccinate synthase